MSYLVRPYDANTGVFVEMSVTISALQGTLSAFSFFIRFPFCENG